MDVDVDCLCTAYLYFLWAQLARYKERSCGNQIGLAKVFKFGAAIEQLEYRTGDPGAIVDVRTSDRPTLTRLRSIDIRLYHNSTDCEFPLLDQFTAPYLESIKIKDHGHDFLPFLLDFVDKCSCGPTLTSLIFYTSPIKPGDLTKILLCTPSLMKLECNDIPFVDLCMFSVRSGQSMLVPLLHDLVIHTPSSSSLSTIDTLAQDRSQMDRRLLARRLGEKKDPLPRSNRSTQLFTLRLVFPNQQRCKEVMATFMGPADQYQETRSILSDNLAELDVQVDELRMKLKMKENGKAKAKRQFRSMWRSVSEHPSAGKRLHEVISYLETVPLERMPESTVSLSMSYYTGACVLIMVIHEKHWAIHVLDKFRTLDPALIPQQSKYNLLDRSDCLVYSWGEFVRRQISKSSWILHGRLCLIHAVELRREGESDVWTPGRCTDRMFIQESQRLSLHRI